MTEIGGGIECMDGEVGFGVPETNELEKLVVGYCQAGIPKFGYRFGGQRRRMSDNSKNKRVLFPIGILVVLPYSRAHRNCPVEGRVTFDRPFLQDAGQ